MVLGAHAVEHGIIVAERQEIGGRALQVAGWMAQHQRAQRACLADERCGRDEIAEAQPRKQRFRKAADIEHAPGGIEGFQRRRGRGEIADLEFVVVLDDDEILLRRRLQKPRAPVDRHGRARRRMVARRDEDGIGIVGQPIRRQALAIDVDSGDLCAAEQQRGADIGMARVFTHRAGAPVEDQPRDHPQRILRADGDEHLVRIGMDAAPRQGARADVIDQPHVVGRRKIARHQDEILARQGAAGAIAPGVEIEQRRVHLAIEERVGIAPPVERF